MWSLGWVAVGLGLGVVQAVATPPPVETLAPFVDFARAAVERCYVAPRDQMGPSLRSAAEAECLGHKSVAELDQVLGPLKDGDPAAFHALTAEQALWDRYVADVCGLAEESRWVDLDTRTRRDGAASGSAAIECRRQAALGRGYYARARRLGDARGFAARIAAQGPSGERVRIYLRRVRSTLAETAKRPRKFPRDRPLVSGEIEELLRKARTIEYSAGQLARATCRGWPALAEALGGVEACVIKAEPYDLAYGPSGRSRP